MNIKTLGLIISAVILTIVIVFLFIKGTVRVEYAPDSEIKTGAMVSTSYYRFKNPVPIPSSIKVGFGYNYFAVTGDGIESDSQRIFVWPILNQTISFKVKKHQYSDISASLEEQLPYLKNIPYDGNDFTITIKDKVAEKEGVYSVPGLIIHLKLTIATNMPDLQQKEYDMLLSSAKKWLQDQGVPNSVPLEVVID